jgi:hypothetical protein
MRFWRVYWRVSLGGLGILMALMVIVAVLGGAPLELFYFAYLWVVLWVVIGLLGLGVKAVRRFANLS